MGMFTNAYGVMVFSPILVLFIKVCTAGLIMEKAKEHGRHFYKRHKGNFWLSYWGVRFWSTVPKILIVVNVVVGIWVIISLLLAIVFLVFWIISFPLHYVFVIEYYCWILYGVAIIHNIIAAIYVIVQKRVINKR